ncbi:MAG: radical SAM/SPASM domain-containing protein [Candidatus Muiribacteriota bacterium]
MFKIDNSLVTISLSEICNIKCIFCYHYDELYDIDGRNVFLEKKSRKFMKFETFKKIFDNLDYEFEEIDMTGYGEPVLNPDFLKIMKYTVNNCNDRFKKVFTSTNGIEMTPQKTDEFLKVFKKTSLKLHFLFSINASNKDTYFNVCGSREYDKVEENAKYFFKRVKELNLNHRIFSSVQMVIVKENMNDVKGFYYKWKKFFDNNNLKFDVEKACACGETLVNENIPHSIAFIVAILANQKTSNEMFENVLNNSGMGYLIEKNDDSTRLDTDFLDIKNYDIRKPCSALWKIPIIGVEGDLYICSRDLAGNYSAGNVCDENFSDIFFGAQMNKWRKNHMVGDFRDPKICFDCAGYEGNSLEEEELKEFFEIFEAPQVYEFYKKRMKDKFLYDYTYVKVDSNQFIKQEKEVIFSEYADITDDITELKYKYKGEPENKIIDRTLLPCAYLTDYRYFTGKGIFCGCDKIKLNINTNRQNIMKMLTGDNSKLNMVCLNCINRLKGPAHFFRRFKDKLNPLWHEFGLEREFFERHLPDFIKEEFDEKFLNKKASEFRESYIRFLLKYDKNPKILKKLNKHLLNCNDAYIYILLLRGLLYNKMVDESVETAKKLIQIYPCDYVNYFFKSFAKILNGIEFEILIDNKYRDHEEQFILLWALKQFKR